MTTLKDWDYHELKIVGRGQYGKAYLVQYGKDQQWYVAKTIDLTFLSKKERESAQQEVELLRRLDHANVVEYKNSFYMGEMLVIVMQYCEGGDLATYIKDMNKRRMRIREKQIMNYFVQILHALHYIHSERILHRDLKTSNLFLLQKAKVVKLGDFGISRVLEGSMQAAITVVGTPYYMSPEVCESKPYTFKSDVWALGCVLYELCVLKHAFSADNLLGLVYKIVSDKYEPIPQVYRPEMNALIQSMLTKKADGRPSVRELLADPYVRQFQNEFVRTKGQCATPASSKQEAVGTVRAGSGAGRGREDGRPGVAEWIDRPNPRRVCAPQSEPRAPASKKHETPKEAAARRKREAADRKAEELKQAAKQASQNKTVARRMKEVEFQSTRNPVGGNSDQAWTTCNSAAICEERDSVFADEVEASPDQDCDEDFSDSPSDAEDFDSYSDDFDSEDFENDSESDELRPLESDVGVVNTVREEEDFTRVMCDYEQDLARGGASPSPPRKGSQQDVPLLAPEAAPQGGVMDLRTRSSRKKEELMQKMGQETFKMVFDFLFKARTTDVDEKSLRSGLEALVGRDVCKQYCFEVDQIVFAEVLYS